MSKTSLVLLFILLNTMQAFKAAAAERKAVVENKAAVENNAAAERKAVVVEHSKQFKELSSLRNIPTRPTTLPQGDYTAQQFLFRETPSNLVRFEGYAYIYPTRLHDLTSRYPDFIDATGKVLGVDIRFCYCYCPEGSTVYDMEIKSFLIPLCWLINPDSSFNKDGDLIVFCCSDSNNTYQFIMTIDQSLYNKQTEGFLLKPTKPALKKCPDVLQYLIEKHRKGILNEDFAKYQKESNEDYNRQIQESQKRIADLNALENIVNQLYREIESLNTALEQEKKSLNGSLWNLPTIQGAITALTIRLNSRKKDLCQYEDLLRKKIRDAEAAGPRR